MAGRTDRCGPNGFQGSRAWPPPTASGHNFLHLTESTMHQSHISVKVGNLVADRFRGFNSAYNWNARIAAFHRRSSPLLCHCFPENLMNPLVSLTPGHSACVEVQDRGM